MKYKLLTYVTLCLMLSSISIVNLVHTVAKTLPSCVSICDATGNTYGAGFIVAKGYVVTARHVTKEELVIYVRLVDGKIIQVDKVIPLNVAKGQPLDAVLLKVSTETLPPAKLGDSEHIFQGQTVFAIGAPYGLEQSITVGIISALHRTFDFRGITYSDTIQTSGLLHPGNSGGPLLSRYGKVLGINVVSIGGSGGIGITVPINQIRLALRRNGLQL